MTIGADEAKAVKLLRRRQDVVLGLLHAITRKRDLGSSLESTLGVEQLLVMELGQIQDRLRMLGEHQYDGCTECRPVSGGQGVPPVRTYGQGNWRSHAE
jgi:hypothetical protein